MPTETTPATSPAPAPPALPIPVCTNITLTWDIPHLLVSVDTNPITPTISVRQGGKIQVQATVTTWFAETQPPAEPVLSLKGRNRINFGQGKNTQGQHDRALEVMNDAISYGGTTLAPTSPTAKEYLALVGKQVTTAFSASLVDPDSIVGKQYRRAALFRCSRTTIILP